MRKILFWFLVLILPLIGLVTGICFAPGHDLLWQYTSEDANLLGFVDEGRTVLFLEKRSSQGLDLAGIDTTSGREAYRIPLTTEHMHPQTVWLYMTTLSSDGKHVVLLSKHLTDSRRQQVVLYSVQSRSVIHRFDMEPDDVVFEIAMSGNTIAAYCSEGKILLQDVTDPARKQWIPWLKGHLHGLSLDGTMHYEISSADQQIAGHLHCYDIRQQLTLTEIPLHCLLLNWISATHFESMTEDVHGNLLVSSYVRAGNTFRLDPAKERMIKASYGWNAIFRKIMPGFILAGYTNENHPVRTWLHSWNILPLSRLTEAVWPSTYRIDLLNRTSLQVDHRLETENGALGFLSQHVRCCAVSHGLASTIGNSIGYWQFLPFSRFIPLIGLTMGCLVSMILLVRHFRKSKISSN